MHTLTGQGSPSPAAAWLSLSPRPRCPRCFPLLSQPSPTRPAAHLHRLCFVLALPLRLFGALLTGSSIGVQTLPGAVSPVQSLSRVRVFETPWTAVCQASLSITSSWSLHKLMSMVGDAIQPPHPLSSPSPPAFSLSQHQGLFK